MKYAAFISYAHSDEAMARRIHSALETYPIPKDMSETARQQLTPIFRDVTELTAHHSLSEKIRNAVQNSRILIVLCSPAAKTSHWVNEEIKLFRELYGEGSILTVIVDGNPQSAFPPALTEDGREPLAADMTTREGFRFGITQLAASMLGVGLDKLVQRDSKRRRNRLRLITASALTFAGIMGGMTWTAIDARDEAEVSRSEAEKMVEYLITDLKQELDAVGRLSILDDVGNRVTEYYDAIPLSDMDDDRLARQARARHILGEVAIKQGRLEYAISGLTNAYKVTDELLDRNSNSAQAIFTHSQSEYWLGKIHLEKGEPEKALPSRKTYSDLSQRLYKSDPDNRKYLFEYGWAENNLGVLHRKLGNYDRAVTHYKSAIQIFQNHLNNRANDPEIIFEIASIRRNLASSNYKRGMISEAKKDLQKSIASLTDLYAKSSDDMELLYDLTSAKLWLQEILISEESCDASSIDDTIKYSKQLVVRDPTNAVWNMEYLQIIRLVTENCSSSFQMTRLHNEVQNALNAAERIEVKDDRTLQNVAWLENYQAKLE